MLPYPSGARLAAPAGILFTAQLLRRFFGRKKRECRFDIPKRNPYNDTVYTQ